ncbi:MAG: hypothetical protein GY863_01430 [bacterium]|nr:hypothetical protein [bacterium]
MSNKTQLLLTKLIVLIFLFPGCESQISDFPVLKGQYLGQRLPGKIPQIFAPNIIGTLDYEGCAVFLKDNNTIVFNRLARNDTDFTFIQIYEMKHINGIWTPPSPVEFQKGARDDNFTAAPDGKTLYFQSNRPTDGTTDLSPHSNVWKAEILQDGWSEPEFVRTIDGNPIKGGYPSVTRDGTLYFMNTTETGFGEYDIFRAKYIDGKYSEPEILDKPVNSEYDEFDSFVASDESYLIFVSDRPGGNSKYNLYISFRSEDDKWSEPIDMGLNKHSTEGTSRPNVTPDGKYFFICKHYFEQDIIYWVSAEIIEDLRPDNFK